MEKLCIFSCSRSNYADNITKIKDPIEDHRRKPKLKIAICKFKSASIFRQFIYKCSQGFIVILKRKILVHFLKNIANIQIK